MAKGHILVVDDNPNLLELIRMRLESADYEVTATGVAICMTKTAMAIGSS